MNDAKKSGANALALALIGLVVLAAIGVGAYVAVNRSKRLVFVDTARGVCSEAAKVDYDFSKLLESPGHSRDQVLDQSSASAKRIADLSRELSNTSAGGLGDVKANLCKALDEHRRIYEVIGSGSRTDEMTQVSQAVESAWRSYGKVDGKVVPLAGVLPGLAADSLTAGLASMKGAPPIAVKPEPQPAVPSAPVTAPPQAEAANPAAAPAVAVAVTPTPPSAKPRAATKASAKRSVAVKSRKPAPTKTAVYRCPYRGCNAWFIKAPLLQRHKKFCIYRPGGPAARARRK